jgi:hypothetical protein
MMDDMWDARNPCRGEDKGEYVNQPMMQGEKERRRKKKGGREET